MDGQAARTVPIRVVGGRRVRRRRPRRLPRGLRLTLWIVLPLTLLAPVVLFGIGYAVFEVPEQDDVVHNQVAVVTHSDGSEFARLVPEQGNRTKVPIGAVPEHVWRTVLAAEDRSFESNPGFDLTGILRAGWNQLSGGGGGGSTITQQYVKTALVGDEHSLWRKYQELVLATRLTHERSKDEILESYLNTIYFGRGAYGIDSAARAYFGKPAERLTLAEGAVLAGLIPSPSRWDPGLDPAKALDRWQFVLDGMVAQGWLAPAERAAAVFPTALPRIPVQPGAPADHRGHVVAAVLAELEAAGITEQDISRRGLRITTTLDAGSQAAAGRALQREVGRQPADLRYAVVAIDPRTGGIAAYYGGSNGRGLDYTRVRRLAGSTFKPFALLGALQQTPPVGLGEVFDGAPVPGLRNSDGADCRRCDLKQAMTISNNVVFNTLAKQVGADTVAAAARIAGITAPLDDPTEGIALGNKEVSALELASAYATVVGGGTWHEPYLVSEVVDGAGRVPLQREPGGEVRIPPRVARNVVESLLEVAPHHGIGFDRPVAAKTGTVQSHLEGETNDAWMAGGTPGLVASVWIGTDRNTPVRTADGRPVEGAGLPAQLWQEVLSGGPGSGTTASDEPFGPFEPIGRPPSNLPPLFDPGPAGVRTLTRPAAPLRPPAPELRGPDRTGEPPPTPALTPPPPPSARTPPEGPDGGPRATGPRTPAPDRGEPDRVPQDAGTQDTGTQDTGTQDTGTQDTGTQDAESPREEPQDGSPRDGTRGSEGSGGAGGSGGR